jgi:glycosyltransferase involved in cell wall biosynthesis
MKKIKIAHILHSIGGVDTSVRLIVKNINLERFDNIIIHGKQDTKNAFLDFKNKPVREYRTSILRDISLINDLKSIFQTYRYLKKERPDIIHAHSAKGGIIGKIVGLFLGIKTLYTPQAFSYLSAQNKFKRIIFLTLERIFANKNSVLLASSNSEKTRGIEEIGYKIDKALVFNNCIEPISSLKPLTINKEWPTEYICTVGRPSYQKNIELMIRVLFEVKKKQKIHLVIMGVGPVSGQLESVKKLIIELDMSNEITLLNWTERSDVFTIIKESKFYISTARYEGMPYSIIESLALSKPCIVSDCDGNRDLIVDGYNGFLIDKNDIDYFKEMIVKLLNNQVLLDQFSKNAYDSFVNNYDIKKNIKELESVYLKYSKKTTN